MAHSVLLAFGTRPEAIKMAPLWHELAAYDHLEPKILLTGQHKEQLEQALEIFDLPVAQNLALMQPRQTLPHLAGRMVPALADAMTDLKAELVLVHGDTLTTFCAAWAAFLLGLPVGHVEAGLRSGSLREPFPEEANRLLTDRLCEMLFAPTEAAAENLRAEGVPAEHIFVTGQTAVDAVLMASTRGTLPKGLKTKGPYITVTLHRRENWPLLPGLGRALAQLARRYPTYEFVCPLHLNPLVREALVPELTGLENVTLLEPLPYGEMAALMARSTLLLTDSGGLQEEGASLGVPVAIARNVTERPEGLGGALTLVGNEEESFFQKTCALLDDPARLARMAQAPNPYGDGKASWRIASLVAKRWQ